MSPEGMVKLGCLCSKAGTIRGVCIAAQYVRSTQLVSEATLMLLKSAVVKDHVQSLLVHYTHPPTHLYRNKAMEFDCVCVYAIHIMYVL